MLYRIYILYLSTIAAVSIKIHRQVKKRKIQQQNYIDKITNNTYRNVENRVLKKMNEKKRKLRKNFGVHNELDCYNTNKKQLWILILYDIKYYFK